MGKKTKSEIGKYSSRKGGRGEREICKLLNKKFNGIVLFERSPRSGGSIYRGDIVPKTPSENHRERIPIVSFPFVFEVKNNEEFSIDRIFVNFESSSISNWWDQVLTDSKDWKKIPILTMTKNYSKIYSLFDKDLFDFLIDDSKVLYNKTHIKLENGFTFCLFSDLLDCLDIDKVMNYVNY